MSKLWLIVDVLYKGKELQNAEAWKKAGVVSGVFTAAINCLIAFFPDLNFGGVEPKMIVDSLTSLTLMFSAYVHVASSSKIGIVK